MAGVDGCPAGWVAVIGRFPPDPADGPACDLDVVTAPSFDGLMATTPLAGAATIVVDMPIGLADPEKGIARTCDSAARARLPGKASSIFTAPIRPVLGAPSHAAASALSKQISGKGLSIQAYNIAAKIAEVDRWMTPARQTRVIEGHPELAFARLAGAPVLSPKQRTPGRAARRALLHRNGMDADGLADLLRDRKIRQRSVRTDDLLDAAVLCLTARDKLLGRATPIGGDACDARGLLMQIWS